MKTTSQLLDQFGMNYTVNKQELVLPSGKPSGIFGTVRTDKDICFGGFSNKYEIFQNSELMELAQGISEETGYKINLGQTFRDGAKVRINLRSKDGILEYKNKGDVIERGFDLTNSFDGSSGLNFSIHHLVLSCTNGATRWVKDSQTNFRHTSGMRDIIAASLTKLKVLAKEEETMFDNIQRMIGVEAQPQHVVKMVESITGLKMKDIQVSARTGKALKAQGKKEAISTRAKNDALALLDSIYKEMGTRYAANHTPKGQNLWGLLSGVTYYTTHIAGREAGRAENKHFGRLNNIDNMAYDLAVETLQEEGSRFYSLS